MVPWTNGCRRHDSRYTPDLIINAQHFSAPSFQLRLKEVGTGIGVRIIQSKRTQFARGAGIVAVYRTPPLVWAWNH